ncbi:hypothetical protein [Nonomuraea turcica]|uniref:hypothetical protein n=1 Tax=Nonomuraea sp. G32 TaxID=3067274 RepID=UPI00273BAA10|nr:hypothetical protein [Nonomuraea sp. G32]MDP4504037.1 hypothetical protein [Nonomuraea sp. G32]
MSWPKTQTAAVPPGGGGRRPPTMCGFGDDGADNHDRERDGGREQVRRHGPAPMSREVYAAAETAPVPVDAELAAFAAAHPDRLGPLVELRRQALAFLSAG